MLRGVNVGGKNKLPSAVLKAACENAGFENVRTYLQSGNVVFTAAAEPDAVLRRLQPALTKASGLTVALILRTGSDFRKLVAKHPFDADSNGSRVAVAFLDGKLPPTVEPRLRALVAEGERLNIGPREIFAYFSNGMGRSKLGNALHDKTLGVPCTVRNWNTVTALAKLADEVASAG
jgi:uncharacterized protein (DUF1697 family)